VDTCNVAHIYDSGALVGPARESEREKRERMRTAEKLYELAFNGGLDSAMYNLGTCTGLSSGDILFECPNTRI
jgi:hypothetical protein